MCTIAHAFKYIIIFFLSEVSIDTMPAYSVEFPFAPEAWTMKKYPRRREMKHIRISERTIRILIESLRYSESLKNPGFNPGFTGREISAYHKHFKRLVENLGEE